MEGEVFCRNCGRLCRAQFCDPDCYWWFRVKRKLPRNLTRHGKQILDAAYAVGPRPKVGSLRALARHGDVDDNLLVRVMRGTTRYISSDNLSKLDKLTRNVIGASFAWTGPTIEQHHKKKLGAIGTVALNGYWKGKNRGQTLSGWFTGQERPKISQAAKARYADKKRGPVLRAAIAKAKRASWPQLASQPSFKAKCLYMQQLRNLLGRGRFVSPRKVAGHPSLTPAIINAWAARAAGDFQKNGLPRLYLRYVFYELACLKWPGIHPPEVRRFELVYALKRQGKEWRQIAHMLGMDPQSLRGWWQRFLSL